jgi:hypothetical protein
VSGICRSNQLVFGDGQPLGEGRLGPAGRLRFNGGEGQPRCPPLRVPSRHRSGQQQDRALSPNRKGDAGQLGQSGPVADVGHSEAPAVFRSDRYRDPQMPGNLGRRKTLQRPRRSERTPPGRADAYPYAAPPMRPPRPSADALLPPDVRPSCWCMSVTPERDDGLRGRYRTDRDPAGLRAGRRRSRCGDPRAVAARSGGRLAGTGSFLSSSGGPDLSQ